MSNGTEIESLIQKAQSAMMSGRVDESTRLWRSILIANPEHGLSLFHLGQLALQQRDVSAARDFLTRAVKAMPQNPVVALNLAFAARMAGDFKEEMEALTQSLNIDPYFYPTLLAKGAFLERTGDREQAAQTYKGALKIIPSASELPIEFQQIVAHARQVVEADAVDLEKHLEARLAKLRSEFSGENLTRFEECKDVFLGKKQVYTVRPTLLHFPQLPAIQFYNMANFPQLASLEANANAVREEALNLLGENGDRLKPYVEKAKGAPVNQWAELNYSPRWSAFFLWKDGVRIDENCALCPNTAKALEIAGMTIIPGYAPTAFFSVLEPHTHIPPHTGVTNTRLVVHLPLIVPEKCKFRVGNDTREWEADKAWVFDDTIEHEAWNDSSFTRVVLIFDVWNPFLSSVERELVCALLDAVRSRK